jgi:hypothetical protein
MVQIGLDHVDLIEVGKQGTDVAHRGGFGGCYRYKIISLLAVISRFAAYPITSKRVIHTFIKAG